MRRQYGLIFLLMTLSYFRSASQNIHYKDSLHSLLQLLPEDSTKVLSYLSYGKLFKTSNSDTAAFYYEKARQLAVRLNYKKGLKEYLFDHIFILNYKGSYQEALESGQKLLLLSLELNDPDGIGGAYHSLGNDYQYLGATEPAIKNYLKACEIFEKTGNKQRLQVTTNNIASIFIDLNEFDKSYAYAIKSLGIAQEMRDTFNIAASLINLAISEEAQKKYDSALRHFEKVAYLGKFVTDYSIVLEGYYNLGNIYAETKAFPRAIEQYAKALKIARDHKNPHYELYALAGLSDCYVGLRQWKQADKYITESIDIAVRVNARRELSIMYGSAAKINEGIGDLKTALAFKNKFEALNDSLLNEKTRTGIHELETKYQTAEKDKAIADQDLLLEKNRSMIRNRNTWLGLSLGGIIFLLLMTILSYRFYQQRQNLNRQTILAMQQEQEVASLKARMEGQDQERQRISKEMHDDIGAGLTTISFLTGRFKTQGSSENCQAAAKISATANALVDKMKEIVWSMNKEYDTMEDLVAYLRHNTGEMMENAGIAYQFSAPDTIPPITLTGEQRRNIYLVVKESLHNTLKHAQATLVSIVFEVEPALFRITIRDNGKGIEMSALGRFGNGLKNMQDRMKTIGGCFEIAADSGTTVKLSVPVIYNETYTDRQNE
jgi:two-component system, NarL family, sensor kinase